MIQVRPYSDDQAGRWDAFCGVTLNGTFLHTRRFLSYHGDRFRDQSLLIEKDGALLGLFPAAAHPQDAAVICSHPGSSYGGLVHAGGLRGAAMMAALEAVCRHYHGAGFRTLQYKVVPHIYHVAPGQDDLYALFRLGARRYRCDLSSAIALAQRLPSSERRRRALKKAQKAGLGLAVGADVAPELWAVLEENLTRKHSVRPTHTLAEITELASRFPENIRFLLARESGLAVAGLVLFLAGGVAHAQYIAASERGYAVNALDLLFEHAILESREAGRRYFDFGISTESGGQLLNEGLYQFKSEFGAAGIVHEFYEIELPAHLAGAEPRAS